MRLVSSLVAVTVIAPRLAALQQHSACGDTQYPPDLPPPSVVLDSAHAIADLAAFAGAKPMVFSLVFNKGDSIARIRPLDQNDAAAAVSLANYVRHQPTVERWAIRVQIAGGDAPQLTLQRARYCPPMLDAGEPDPIAVQAHQEPGMTMGSLGGGTVQVEALVRADGKVVEAHLTRSSGDKSTDDRLLRDYRRKHFKPALLDDAPVDAVYRSGGESPRP